MQYNSIEKEIVVRNNDRGRIKIYDMQGKLIFDAQTNAISQNFPWNRTGVFVVEFVSGKKISTTKFACNY